MPQLGLVPAADKICFHWDLISIVSRHFGSNHIGSNHFIVVRTYGGWGIPNGGWNLEHSTALLPRQSVSRTLPGRTISIHLYYEVGMSDSQCVQLRASEQSELYEQ